MKNLLSKASNRYLIVASAIGAWAVGVVGVAGATADPNLTSATSNVTDYFTANIGTVITAFVGIAVFLWLLKIALHTFGVKKPTTVA